MTRVKKQKEKNKMNHKKIVTFLTITALATLGPLTFYNDINAKSLDTINLKNFLKSEASVRRTKISEKIEKKLNEQGIFDDEINMLDKQTIKNVEEGNQYSVYIDYFEENTEDGDISDKEMSATEVDNLISEQCNNVENSKFEYTLSKKEDNVFKKILKKLSFGTVDVKAKEDTDYSNSGKCKRTLVLSKNGSKKVNVSVVYNWVKSPEYRLTDYVNVYLKNASPDKSTGKAYYTCDYWVNINGKKNYGSRNFQYTYKNMSLSDKSMAFKAKLVDEGYKSSSYNHKLGLSYTATIDNNNWNYVVATGEYLHQKANVSISPSITFSSSGAFGFSASINKKLVKLTNPPQVKLSIK